MPVTRLDGRPVKDGAIGPITELIQKSYWRRHEDARFIDRVSYPA